MMKSNSKRTALKTLSILSVGTWVPPLLKAVILPAHGQTSGFSPTCVIGDWSQLSSSQDSRRDRGDRFVFDVIIFQDNGIVAVTSTIIPGLASGGSVPNGGRWVSDGRNVTITFLRSTSNLRSYQLSGVLSEDCFKLSGTIVDDETGEVFDFVWEHEP